MATLTKQLVHAHWHILADYPSKNGEYVVFFEEEDGNQGVFDIWIFNSRIGWSPLFNESYELPSHWCDLPMPR